jgi:DNA-binding response OmpR family regulator
MTTQRTVLIVDDEHGMLELLKIFFERAKYRVVTADNGVDAITLVERHHPDAIIMDYMLPDIPGGEVCQIIKQSPGIAHIPVIMHSANPRIIDRVYMHEIGASDAVIKPCDVRKLVETVEKHLVARA